MYRVPVVAVGRVDGVTGECVGRGLFVDVGMVGCSVGFVVSLHIKSISRFINETVVFWETFSSSVQTPVLKVTQCSYLKYSFINSVHRSPEADVTISVQEFSMTSVVQSEAPAGEHSPGHACSRAVVTDFNVPSIWSLLPWQHSSTEPITQRKTSGTFLKQKIQLLSFFNCLV